jgi:hypothetical protein
MLQIHFFQLGYGSAVKRIRIFCFGGIFISLICVIRALGQDDASVKANIEQLKIDYQKSSACTSYDKFKDEAKIWISITRYDIATENSVNLVFGWANQGSRVTKSSSMELVVGGTSIDSINLLIDGSQRITLNLNNGVAILDSDTLRALYGAKLIEIKIGDMEISLKQPMNIFDTSTPDYTHLHYFLDYFFRFPEN